MAYNPHARTLIGQEDDVMHVTRAMNGLSREKISRKGANKLAQHHGKSAGSRKGEIYADLKFYLKTTREAAPAPVFPLA